jgi:hypothetical protein
MVSLSHLIDILWRIRKSFSVCSIAKRWPLKRQLQLRPVHLSRTYVAPVADKSSRLLLLAPHVKYAAIKVQNSNLPTASIDENVKGSVQRS